MKKCLDESGYALVAVLFIITIFSILALSFASQAFNSSKQNKVVEAKAQSVALAEMGVTYFEHAVKNAYIDSQNDVKVAVQAKMDTDRNEFYENPANENKSWDPDETYYLKFAAEEMVTMMNVKLDGIKEQQYMKVEGLTEAHFTISPEEEATNTFAILDENNVVIAFKSNGYETNESEKSFTLSAKLTIEFNDLEFNKVGEEGEAGGTTPENGLKLPDFNKITRPTSPECLNPTSLNNCGSILIQGNGSFSNSNQMKNILPLYSAGSLVISGNANSMSNVHLHAGASLEISMNMNSVTNSIIETGGSAKFGSQLRMDNSELLIGGAAHIVGHLTVSKGSFVYIGGNLKVEKELTLEDASTVCVREKLEKVGDGIKIKDSNSKLYVWGPNNKEENLDDQILKIDNEQDWKEKCGTGHQTGGTITPNFNWGDIRQEINYEY